MVMLVIEEISKSLSSQVIFMCTFLILHMNPLINYFISGPLPTILILVTSILPQDTCVVADIHHNEEVAFDGLESMRKLAFDGLKSMDLQSSL